MNFRSLSFLFVFILCVSGFLSCKKTNELHSYPENNRLLNFTKTYTAYSQPDYIDNYRFVYDGNNRVSQIIYTTNNPGLSNNISNFRYASDTIYDYITQVNGTLIELDTFITNTKGNIEATYIQGLRTGYQYFGKLVTRIDYPYGFYSNLTSYNGNFIREAFSTGSANDGVITYYTDLDNRPGDYLYLQAFSRYGLNIFQNSSLVKSLTYPFYKTTAEYVIDADRKITKTIATVQDTAHLPGTNTLIPARKETYEIQYERIN